MNRDTASTGDFDVEEGLAKRTSNRRSGWSKLEPRYRYMIIGFSVFIVLLIAGIVVAIVLTRKEGVPIPPIISVPPTPVNPSVPPGVVRRLLLKNSAGDCFSFPSFKPTLGTPDACDTGEWVQSDSQETLSFESITDPLYLYCMQIPSTDSTPVYGSTGTDCAGVRIVGNTIKAITTKDPDTELCINDMFGDIQWSDCSSAFQFTLDYLS